MLKNIIAFFLILVIIITPLVSVKASKPQMITVTHPEENEISIFINDVLQNYDQPPIVENNRTLVPLRGIFEALGAKIEWNQEEKLITATKGNTTILLEIGSDSPTVNGKTVTIEVPAKALNNRTLVPLRFVSEALGAKVEYDQKLKRVDITPKSEINYTLIEYKAIKVDNQLLGYENIRDSTVFYPYVTSLFEIEIDGEKDIYAPGIIDVRQYSKDTFGTQSGLFNLLQILVGEYYVVDTDNPFLSGNIQLFNAKGNWTTTNHDLANSKLKLGYTVTYESATNKEIDQWYEFNAIKFRDPKDFYQKEEGLFFENGIKFVRNSKFSSEPLFVSVNDLLDYLGIDKEITYDSDGDLTFIEVKNK